MEKYEEFLKNVNKETKEFVDNIAIWAKEYPNDSSFILWVESIRYHKNEIKKKYGIETYIRIIEQLPEIIVEKDGKKFYNPDLYNDKAICCMLFESNMSLDIAMVNYKLLKDYGKQNDFDVTTSDNNIVHIAKQKKKVGKIC